MFKYYIHEEGMFCSVCQRTIPVEEVLWDIYEETGEVFCINCNPDDAEGLPDANINAR